MHLAVMRVTALLQMAEPLQMTAPLHGVAPLRMAVMQGTARLQTAVTKVTGWNAEGGWVETDEEALQTEVLALAKAPP
jgi:hypothetical protein